MMWLNQCLWNEWLASFVVKWKRVTRVSASPPLLNRRSLKTGWRMDMMRVTTLHVSPNKNCANANMQQHLGAFKRMVAWNLIHHDGLHILQHKSLLCLISVTNDKCSTCSNIWCTFRTKILLCVSKKEPRCSKWNLQTQSKNTAPPRMIKRSI